MSIRRIVITIALIALAIVAVVTINWFLEGLLNFLVPGATMTPELEGPYNIIVQAAFFVIDVITIIAIFKWLRR